MGLGLGHPLAHQLPDLLLGVPHLSRVTRVTRLHVLTVRGPGDEDGGGSLVKVRGDPQRVPGVTHIKDVKSKTLKIMCKNKNVTYSSPFSNLPWY